MSLSRLGKNEIGVGGSHFVVGEYDSEPFTTTNNEVVIDSKEFDIREWTRICVRVENTGGSYSLTATVYFACLESFADEAPLSSAMGIAAGAVDAQVIGTLTVPVEGRYMRVKVKSTTTDQPTTGRMWITAQHDSS